MEKHEDLLPISQGSETRPTHRRATNRFPQILAVSGAVALALSACAASGGSDTSSAPSTEPSTNTGSPMASGPASSSSANSMSTPSSPPSSSTAMASNTNTSLEGAAQTALKEVPDSTVVSIETEANKNAWEVQVVTGNGTEHEVRVSMSDGSIMGSPSTKQEDAQDRKKHQDRVAAAKLDYQEAAEKMRDAVPGARVAELNLDTDAGKTVWEADLVDTKGTKLEVTIDAANGAVIKKS